MKPKTKFQVGDRVKIIKNISWGCSHPGNHIGEIVTVREILYSGGYAMKGYPCQFYEEEGRLVRRKGVTHMGYIIVDLSVNYADSEVYETLDEAKEAIQEDINDGDDIDSTRIVEVGEVYRAKNNKISLVEADLEETC